MTLGWRVFHWERAIRSPILKCNQEFKSVAHGGSRTGAGRKAGAPTAMNQEARAKAAAGGITPLDYMLGILRDDAKTEALRFEAAKAAAPYVHAKLANIDANVKANVDGTVTFTWLPSS